MLRLYRWLSIVLIFAAALAVSAQEGVTGTVNVNGLNVRSAPTTASQIITQVNLDEVYVVLAQAQGEDGRWWQIQLNDEATGWVYGRYLEVQRQDDVPTVAVDLTDFETVELPATVPEPITTADLTAVTQGVNVRSGPSTSFRIIGGLVEGTEVQVIGRNLNSTWVKIAAPEAGWIIAGVLPNNFEVAGLPVPPDAFQAAVAQGFFWEIGISTHLRMGPLLGTPLLGFVEAGRRVQLLSRNETLQWVKVAANGETGWIPAETLAPGLDISALPLEVL